MDNKLIGNEKNILFYNDEEGNTKVEVLLENDDVWLNTEALAALFNVKRPAITKHINNIYEDEELEERRTCSKMEHMGDNGSFGNSFVNWFPYLRKEIEKKELEVYTPDFPTGVCKI